MEVKLVESDDTIFAPGGVISGTSYLNVCAHCGECLKQLVSYPNKLNVVVFYRDEKGDYIEWKPEEKEDD